VIDAHGRRRDLHLKGSGRTPFARGGDGKAAVGPMLREYLIGEAMHALGIATTRALAVVATGEQIARDSMLPGAVLTRVASSHLRVGTFQYAAAQSDLGLLRRLTDHAIARHYPAAAQAERPALALLDGVIEAQAALIAQWMTVGFVHGVMNTDNMTISGETIDYGPCAFLDAHHPATVFSSIDHQGRYAYGNQPRIGLWNLARLAEALLPLVDDDDEAAVAAVTERLHTFGDRFDHHWLAGMRDKLGLLAPAPDDKALFDDLLAHGGRAPRSHRHVPSAGSVLRGAERRRRWPWIERWRERLADDGATLAVSPRAWTRPIRSTSPQPPGGSRPRGRNRRRPAVRALVDIVSQPYDERPGRKSSPPAPADFRPLRHLLRHLTRRRISRRSGRRWWR
jgi:uncharacterized protein YdiU (UPF0061 family)